MGRSRCADELARRLKISSLPCAYLDLIADEVGVPITLVSARPDEQTILLRDPL